MCGFVGIATCQGRPLPVSDDDVRRARDRLVHRGPDDAGFWSDRGVAIGHRRLCILDPSPLGHQPWVTGRGVLAYNGELYNDADLRQRLDGPWRS
ncbi:MAG: hypothetical protein KDA28_00675, partial [Phycisphaerales bacterium]|nr:hypothetical protein [Phycisphaerales bacterium]